jgi:beta-N-acetylhexosaminidase
MAREDCTVIVAIHDVSANSQQIKLIQGLVDEGIPVIVLASRNPFDVMKVPEAATVLISYGLNPPVREALAEVLAGKLQPSGQLPIDLP